MAVGRHGVWKCPNCGHHQIWKTRNHNTSRLDRQCEKCENRARVTLDRSVSGQGRNRIVNIWERSTNVSLEELITEAARRNDKEIEINHITEDSDKLLQTNLPIIWGKN